jgi:hypothetical protein
MVLSDQLQSGPVPGPFPVLGTRPQSTTSHFPDLTSTLHSTYWTCHSLVTHCLSVCYKKAWPWKAGNLCGHFPHSFSSRALSPFLVFLIIVSRTASLGQPPLPTCSTSSGVMRRDALSIAHGSKPILSFLHPPSHSFPNSLTWTTPGSALTPLIII